MNLVTWALRHRIAVGLLLLINFGLADASLAEREYYGAASLSNRHGNLGSIDGWHEPTSILTQNQKSDANQPVSDFLDQVSPSATPEQEEELAEEGLANSSRMLDKLFSLGKFNCLLFIGTVIVADLLFVRILPLKKRTWILVDSSLI